jgi:hypothetical protein
LTNGTGSNSTSLIVDDANFFFSEEALSIPDTDGLIESDTIYVNATSPFSVQITNISSNTLTLASAQTWQDGVEVYICPGGNCFSGSAPEIGYLESATTPSGSNITISNGIVQ